MISMSFHKYLTTKINVPCHIDFAIMTFVVDMVLDKGAIGKISTLDFKI